MNQKEQAVLDMLDALARWGEEVRKRAEQEECEQGAGRAARLCYNRLFDLLVGGEAAFLDTRNPRLFRIGGKYYVVQLNCDDLRKAVTELPLEDSIHA